MIFSSILIQALQQQNVGQEYSIAALARAVTVAMAGMAARDRPLATLLFLGLPGSGKTHLACSFARVMLGDERRMMRVDCQRLVRDGHLLSSLHRELVSECWRSQSLAATSALSIILVEGIDEAPASLRDSLASEIERGEIVTGGLCFPLRNSFIILTATLSKKKADQVIGRTIGFFRDGDADSEMPRQHLIALEEMDNLFGARLVSNIDEIIIFDRPSEQNIVTLFERRLAEIERLLASRSIGFMIDQDAKTFLVRRSVEDLAHGMRQLNRTIRNYLEFPLADLVLSGRLAPGTTVSVKHESPRNFLNFQIMIPRFAAGQPTLIRPHIVRTDSIG